MNGTLPWRGPGPGRPDLPLPPGRMPMLRAGRPRKRWRYVGVYGPDLMLCVGAAQVGPSWQSWWAVWDRKARRLHERTRMGRRGVRLEPGRVRVDAEVAIDLVLEEGGGIEVVCPSGRAYAWTRKQGGVPARGTVRLPSGDQEVDGLAVIDESAGYHERHTAWAWSAGVGSAPDGRAVAWNLVTGINDPATASERTLWIDGEAREVGPNTFASDLAWVAFAEGGRLDFATEATRERDERYGPFSSRYTQPFGTFSGTLPGGVELATGFGVMERHEARW